MGIKRPPQLRGGQSAHPCYILYMTFISPRRQLGDRPESIELEGRTFSFVTRQRGYRSAIYAAPDAYLRIGAPEKIIADVAFHKEMASLGFPVAPLLHEGTHNGEQYYIESSVGEKHFGALFAENIAQQGSISDALFDTFLSLMERFAHAQVRTATQEKDFTVLSTGIWFEKLCAEMPAHADRLRQRFARMQERTAVLPFVLTHGDCNPNNLYPAGAIDLEDSFYAPFGYDLYSALVHIDSFPDSPDYEYFAKYRFTQNQKEQYMHMLDTIALEHNLPKLSGFVDDFAFCRAVWLAADIPATPKLQQFRYDLIINDFLS